MAKFKKWFTYASLLTSSLYIFGIYLDVHKNVFVSNFFYSPIFIFILVGSLLFSLLLLDIDHRKEKKNNLRASGNISFVSHKNFSVDANLLREELENATDEDEFISISNVSIYEDTHNNKKMYFFDFLIFLRPDTSVALEPLTSKLTTQFYLLLQEKFGSEFPFEVHIRYVNQKDPFPSIDTSNKSEPEINSEPIQIPDNISHKSAPKEDIKEIEKTSNI